MQVPQVPSLVVTAGFMALPVVLASRDQHDDVLAGADARPMLTVVGHELLGSAPSPELAEHADAFIEAATAALAAFDAWNRMREL